MAELGESTELAAELATEAVDGAGGKPHRPAWHTHAAFSALVMAVLAAISALFGGITAHESLLDRTEEIVELSRLEGDRTTIETLRSKHDILTALGLAVDPAEVARIAAFEAESAELERKSAAAEEASRAATSNHLFFAVAATVLSVGIAVVGLSIVLRRRWLWAAGVGAGIVACGVLGAGIVELIA